MAKFNVLHLRFIKIFQNSVTILQKENISTTSINCLTLFGKLITLCSEDLMKALEAPWTK